MPCKEKISKLLSKCNWILIARICFVVLVVMQCSIFGVAYVGIYSSKEGIEYITILALVIVFVTWIGTLFCYRKRGQLSKLWIVWTVYVTVLACFIAYIFGWLREKLDKKNFWGPNNLKITLCITPVIAIVLIATAKDSRKYGDLVHRFYGGLVLELFDAIEVLAIVISPQDVTTSSPAPAHFNSSLNSISLNYISSSSNTNSVKLPVGLVIAIILFAILSLLLSPLEMAEKKLYGQGQYKPHRRLYLSRLVLKKLLVNLALMITRLVAWLEYKHEASIFIVKNATIIVVAIIGILKYLTLCGLSIDNNKVNV